MQFGWRGKLIYCAGLMNDIAYQVYSSNITLYARVHDCKSRYLNTSFKANEPMSQKETSLQTEENACKKIKT